MELPLLRLTDTPSIPVPSIATWPMIEPIGGGGVASSHARTPSRATAPSSLSLLMSGFILSDGCNWRCPDMDRIPMTEPVKQVLRLEQQMLAALREWSGHGRQERVSRESGVGWCNMRATATECVLTPFSSPAPSETRAAVQKFVRRVQKSAHRVQVPPPPGSLCDSDGRMNRPSQSRGQKGL